MPEISSLKFSLRIIADHFRKIVEIKIDLRVTVYVSGDLRLRLYEIYYDT